LFPLEIASEKEGEEYSFIKKNSIPCLYVKFLILIIFIKDFRVNKKHFSKVTSSYFWIKMVQWKSRGWCICISVGYIN